MVDYSSKDITIDKVCKRLRKNARLREISSYILIFITLAVTGFSVFFFSQTQTISGQYAGSTDAHVSFLTFETTISTETQADLTDRPPSEQEIFFRNLTMAIVRIAAVILAVFIIQHLISFARYNMQVATRMAFSADLLELSGGDADDIKDLSEGLAIHAVNFGKQPEHGYEKTLNALGSIIPKTKN